MMIRQKALTLAAMTALSVGAVFAQGTVSKPAKPSNQPMASKMAEEQPKSETGKKKVGKHVHERHHNKSKKHASSTPTQDSTTKK